VHGDVHRDKGTAIRVQRVPDLDRHQTLICESRIKRFDRLGKG
jgi:hypothetical protein